MSFPGTGTIWMNGTLVEWKDATIHIGSHVIHYGSGVFEGARCYDTPKGSAVFRLDEHLVRLINSDEIQSALKPAGPKHTPRPMRKKVVCKKIKIKIKIY